MHNRINRKYQKVGVAAEWQNTGKKGRGDSLKRYAW